METLLVRLVNGDKHIFRHTDLISILEHFRSLGKMRFELSQDDWWNLCINLGIRPEDGLKILYRNGIYCENIQLKLDKNTPLGRLYIIDFDRQSHGVVIRRTKHTRRSD